MSKWKTDNWLISKYNFDEKIHHAYMRPNKFELHDATMRDGAHVVDYSHEERIQLTRALSELGVHRIEIESRASTIKRQSVYSPETHCDTLKSISKMDLNSRIFTMKNLSEGRLGIDHALSLNISNIVLQEPVHRGWLEQTGDTVEQRIDLIHEVISYAKDKGCYIDFFNNHIGNSELEYLLKIAKAGVDSGADSICLTDSEGNCAPHVFKFLVKKVIDASGGKIPVEVHPHNDYGLALANTIASYEAGASVTHCCVNSLGSRAGNTSLEEAVIALHVLYGVELGLDYSKLNYVCGLVEQMQQWPVAKNKPFYGYGIFSAPHSLKYFGKKPYIK
jgi:methanogen homocitrate synthase